MVAALVPGRYLRHLAYIPTPGVAARILRGYARALLFNRPTLRSVEVAVTYACQAKCPHCYASFNNHDARPLLTPEQIGNIVAQALPLGLIHFNLTGGEAVLRPDLFSIIAACQPRKLILTLNTNGLALTRPLVQQLGAAGVRSLSISLDSADPAVHDRLRGVPGCFAQALAAAAWAREAGMIVCFCTVLAKNPEADAAAVGKLLVLAEHHDAWLLIIDAAVAGRWQDHPEQSLTWDERNVLLADLLRHPRARHHAMYTYYGRAGCPAGKEKIYITPQGDVTPCNFSVESFGSVLHEPLAGIIERIRRDHRYAGARCARYPANTGNG